MLNCPSERDFISYFSSLIPSNISETKAIIKGKEGEIIPQKMLW